MSEIRLPADQLEQLASLIADRLAQQNTIAQLVTAEELALMLKVDAKSIYRHADQLGAIRVGRALRFDPAKALVSWAAEHAPSNGTAPKPTRPRAQHRDDLLPVGRRR